MPKEKEQVEEWKFIIELFQRIEDQINLHFWLVIFAPDTAISKIGIRTSGNAWVLQRASLLGLRHQEQ
ncbi:MAG: hypothetical protein GY705_02175 [Bacteroidetes bacterium]|nr:hypothetical protein [Bacteroidota bacterium]